MKRLLIVLALLGSAIAQTTTTFTGVIKDLSSTPATSGKVTFDLQPSTDTTISGVARFTPQTVTCGIDGAGNVKNALLSGPCVVTNNTSLTPGGTSYLVSLCPSFNCTSSFVLYALGGTVDITTVVPTSGTLPAYSFMDLFSNQTIGGNKTFTGTTSFGDVSHFGAVSQLNLSAVNGIINVKDYGAKGDGVTDDAVAIQAAITDAFNKNREVFFPSTGNAISGSTIYLTSKLIWQGVSLIGPDCSGANPIGLATHGCVVIQSKPGQDIFASLSPTDPSYLFVYQNFLVNNLSFVVDDSVDVSATVGATRFLGKTEYDGSCTAGTSVVTSPNSMWSQGDAGHGFRLADGVSPGVDLVTTIVSVDRNTAEATLATNCVATVAATKVYTSVTGTSTTETAGNCAIAVPVHDGAITVNGNPGFQKATFMNVSFEGLSGADLGQNHSCGIYTNATPYGTTFQNIQFARLWLGYGDAPPPVNPNSQDWAADANHWMDFTANNTNYPLIEYDSTMSEFNRVDLYSGHGFYLLGEKVYARYGNSEISIIDYYDEANAPITSGPHSWFTGTGFVVEGGNLLSRAGGGHGIVQWDASESVINNTIMTGDGSSNVLNITGNMNKVLAHVSSVASSVGDTGLGNEIVVTGYSNITLNHLTHVDHSPQATGQLDSYSILNGNAAKPYDSMSDLLLTPAEMQGVNEATRVVTPDAGVTLTRSYYTVPANGGFTVGGSNGTGNGSYFVIGTAIPAGKIRVYVFGKASAGCTQSFSLYDPDSATVWSAPGNLTWTTSYALGVTGSGNYFDADLTAAVAGHHIAFSGGTCGTSTVNLGWIALRPWKGDEEVDGPITAGSIEVSDAAMKSFFEPGLVSFNRDPSTGAIIDSTKAGITFGTYAPGMFFNLWDGAGVFKGRILEMNTTVPGLVGWNPVGATAEWIINSASGDASFLGKLGIGTLSPTSKLQVVGLPVYGNNAAAIAGGLTAGAFYRTGADPDPVMVVH